MQFDESGERIVMQPETELEQSCLIRLAGVLNEADGGPTAAFTLDLETYQDLDLDLWRSATFDPVRNRADVGSRALVLHHGDDQ